MATRKRGTSVTNGKRPPGRPRSTEVDRRILDAAMRALAEHGCFRMSMDAIAAEAGVSKPTIYRRFASKAELAFAALAAHDPQATKPASGNTRQDLIAGLRGFQECMDRPFGMTLIGHVLAEEHEVPRLLTHFREDIALPRRQILRAILEQAQRHGELRPEADIEDAINLLYGAYYAQYLVGVPFPGDWAERMVDMVLWGLSRA